MSNNIRNLRITSLATVEELFQKYPQINRVILRRVDAGDDTYDITHYDSDRPNDLKWIAEKYPDKQYERNPKRGFEALSGYDGMTDATFKVIYRLDPQAAPIDELQFTERSLRLLKENRICSVGDLTQLTEVELLQIPNLGRKACDEIKDILARHGLSLRLKA